MKHRFAFAGVASPVRKKLQRPLLRAARAVGPDSILEVAEELWECDEREFHYVGADMLRAQASKLRPDDLDRIRALLQTNSWWDTVDSLASYSVGGMVAQHHELVSFMDEWIDDDDFWIARSAILHQIRYKDATDGDRLFTYVDKRAADTEFFIRKALGWALREYAKIAPERVRRFVGAREETLSGLTKREALKHLQ